MKVIEELGMLYTSSSLKYKKRYGLYECEMCMSLTKMIVSDVKRRKVRYCKSCSTSISKTTHGQNKTPLHTIWLGIRSRCFSHKNTSYSYYGGAGVGIDEEWSDNFLSFKKWCIDNKWEKGMHISRTGDSGDYSPSNCVIKTKKENIGERNTLYAKRKKEER